MPFAEGDVILAEHGGKMRPGVVLRVTAGGVLRVFFGTTTAGKKRPIEPVVVVVGTKEHARMKLVHTTHFYDGAITHVDPARAKPTGGTCPLHVLARLRAMVDL